MPIKSRYNYDMEISVLRTPDQEEKNNLYGLWESVLGDQWPIELQNFNEVIFNANSTNFIIKNDDKVVGLLLLMITQQWSVSWLIKCIKEKEWVLN